MVIKETSLELLIPSVPKYCVYILMNHDAIVYIGTTQMGIRGIFENKNFSSIVNKVLLIEAKDAINMLKIQNDMIIKYKPANNNQLNNLAHRVSTLKYDFEPIYFFSKRAIDNLIDNSGVDVIHIGDIDYLDDKNYNSLFTYADDTIMDKDINKDLSPSMLNVLDIMINHGGILYKAKHHSIWFYDLDTWNSLLNDYKQKVEWAEDYNFEFFISYKSVLNDLESKSIFCVPKSFWYTSCITSQLKALANRNFVSLNLSEGICKLTNKKYLE